MCRTRAKKLMIKVQFHNVLIGWLGFISFLLIPFFIFGNFINYGLYLYNGKLVNDNTQHSESAESDSEYNHMIILLQKIKEGNADVITKASISNRLISNSKLSKEFKEDLFDQVKSVYS